MLRESYVVTDGLDEGEEIVTSGAFSVDAAAQLQGKPSMMNPGGGILLRCREWREINMKPSMFQVIVRCAGIGLKQLPSL